MRIVVGPHGFRVSDTFWCLAESRGSLSKRSCCPTSSRRSGDPLWRGDLTPMGA